MNMQLSDLRWLGLNWDEGVEVGGPNGPYRQSERKEIYQQKAVELVKSGKAFYCFCTEEELTVKKEKAVAENKAPHYDGTHRNLTFQEAQERLSKGEKATIRFKVDVNKAYGFNDMVRGNVDFPEGMVGDFVILRSDGMPVYNFCCVVDDALMGITHVLRGEEHLSNTVRQLMLYEAFGFVPPVFGHLSIILGADKQKLSKRHGATSCDEYRRQGYLPEALKNFICLLGWSHRDGKEILTEEEMIQSFDPARFHSSPAVFDEVKLKWMNAQHLRALPDVELWQRILDYLDYVPSELTLSFANPDWILRAMPVFKPAMETLADVVELLRPFDPNEFQVSQEGKEVLSWPTTEKVLSVWTSLLEQRVQAHGGADKAQTTYLSEQDFNELQATLQKEAGVKGKQLFQPLRVFVIGKPQGAELKLLVPLIPVSELLRRAGVMS